MSTADPYCDYVPPIGAIWYKAFGLESFSIKYLNMYAQLMRSNGNYPIGSVVVGGGPVGGGGGPASAALGPLLAMRPEAWAMNHDPRTIKNQLIGTLMIMK